MSLLVIDGAATEFFCVAILFRSLFVGAVYRKKGGRIRPQIGIGMDGWSGMEWNGRIWIAMYSTIDECSISTNTRG
jgi:hypothetical protein